MLEPADTVLQQLESYREHCWWKRPGDDLRDAQSYLHDTVGFVLLANRDAGALERDFCKLRQLQDEGALF